MSIRGKKLGLLVSVPPGHSSFQHAVRLAEAAMEQEAVVFLYLIDDAVRGSEDPRLCPLRDRGLRLFACAYGAQRRGLPTGGDAIFGGLSLVSDLIAATDRFLAFN